MKPCGNCDQEIEDHLDLCDSCEECSHCRMPVMSDESSDHEFWLCEECSDELKD